MKRIVTTALSAITLLLSLTGCERKVLGKVEDLAFTSSGGEISWSEVKDATEYEYTVDGKHYARTSETEINIFDLVHDTSVSFFKVRARKGNKTSDYSSISFETKKLATPNRPTITNDPKTHSPIFTWEKVEGASRYSVSDNGEKFVIAPSNEYQVYQKGDHSIRVKCRSYVKKKQIVYLESDISSESDILNYIPGPLLRTPAINTITWSSDESFDSYNVYVDGAKVRENVVSSASTPLDLVVGDNPIITKTGEYTIQIEAIKNGKSYWSNLLEEFGTSNINENEFYSFDNRIFKPVTNPEGWRVTSEKYHSEPCSLYVPKQTQVNMVKYASSGVNDVDYRRVNKMDMWVYVPTVEGSSETRIGRNYLPTIIYDGYDKETGTAPNRRVAYCKEESVPINKWTHIHYEVENQESNVVIFSKGADLPLDEGKYTLDGKNSVSVPLYIDDISYSDIDPLEIDYDYKLKYDYELAGHGWTNKPQTLLSLGKENKNKYVNVSMDVCGTASITNKTPIGFGAFDNNKKLTDESAYPIDRQYISNNKWHTINLNVKLDDNGDFNTAACYWNATSSNNETFNIYIKNVNANNYQDMTLVKKHFNASGTYISILPIPTNYEVGTDVEVSLDVLTHIDDAHLEYKVAELRTAYGLYPADGEYSTHPIATPKYSTVLSHQDLLSSNNKWQTVTFFSTVLGHEEITFDKFQETTEGETTIYKPVGYTAEFGTENNYILLYLHGHILTDSFYYKMNSVDISQVNKANPAGNNGNSEDRYYQSIFALSVEQAAGSSIEVEMDVNISGIFNDYSEIYAAESVYTTDGGELNAKIDLKSNFLSEEGWHHIKFVAPVRNFSSLRFDSSYPAFDTSSFGNAIYIITRNKSEIAFHYKNVVVNQSAIDEAVPAGDNGQIDKYYQSVVFLPADYDLSAIVDVEMDVYLNGTFVEDSHINVVESVYTTDGGELKNRTEITNLFVGEEGWHHVSFTAPIRNFSCLRYNTSYETPFDTSSYGNGVYILIRNKSVNSLYYRNVSITLNHNELIKGGSNGGTGDEARYQSITGLSSNLEVGEYVEISMDVLVIGDIDKVYAVNSVWSESDAAMNSKYDITPLIDNESTEWQHISFTAPIRNFSQLRYSGSYSTKLNTSSFGNAVYIIATTKDDASAFTYKNVSLEKVDVGATINGGAKSDNYHQNVACITTDLAVGTTVEVSMDVYLDGSFDQYASIRWVDSIYSNGSTDGTTDITSLFKDGNDNWLSGWNRITFNATVRNFSSLRLNDAYENLVDTSSFGNAIYVIAQNKDSRAFIYKNVEMETYSTLIYGGPNKTGNGFHQSAIGLSTDFEVGTTVQIEMDVYVTGSFNEYSSIYVVDSVWTTAGGERNNVTNIKSIIVNGEEGWHHITFTATVRNFTNLRNNSNYETIIDTSSFGNAIYILTENNSSAAFNYRNVVITIG